MHEVFGIKNHFFAKMLFNYLTDRGAHHVPINFQMFIRKLMPFWLPSLEEFQFNEDNKVLTDYVLKE